MDNKKKEKSEGEKACRKSFFRIRKNGGLRLSEEKKSKRQTSSARAIKKLSEHCKDRA